MIMTEVDSSIRVLEFTRDQRVEAPIDIVFETLLEECGPRNERMPGDPMPMTLEAWPGGRWFRDLGDNAGHLWGHVQVIKPPNVLEICGPMFMSYPAAGHISWRLRKDGAATILTLTYKAFGLIPEEHSTGVRNGWTIWMERIARSAEAK